MNKYIICILLFFCSIETWGDDGDVFTSTTIEGVSMTFKVISETDKTCQVGRVDGIWEANSNSIPTEYNGTITIPNDVNGYHVVRIGRGAFDHCNIKSINMPTDIQSIYREAFNSCYYLQSVVLPANLVKINGLAFNYCIALKEILIPVGVDYIGEDAFRACRNLESISVAKGNDQFDSRNNCNAIIESSSNELRLGCKNSIIPSTVSVIGKYAFPSVDESIPFVVPDNIITIKESAFEACQGLFSLVLPNSVTAIENMAFYKCSNLVNVKSLIKNPFSIQNGTFSDISPDAALEVPKGTKSLYQQYSGWTKNFASIVEEGGVTAYNLSINSRGNGSVLFNGENIRESTKSFTVDEGTNVTISISPDNGFQIKNIIVNNSNVSAGSSYSTTINADTKIEVEFEAIPPKTFVLTITASGNGSASYSGETIRGGSKSFTLNEGTSATVTFSPDDGCRIKIVKVNGTTVSAGSSYTVTVNSNTKVEVEFEAVPVTTCTLTITASGNGSASYGNETIRGGSKSFTVNEGTSAKVSFSPDSGYRIKSVKVDGSNVDAGSSYTVTVNSNTTVVVEFEAIPVDPTPTPTPTTYTLSISASGNGTASYSGSSIRSTTRSFTVNEGTSVTISFRPDDGYQIKSVSVNGSTVSAGSSYTVTVNSNITIAVEFEAKPVDPIPVSTDYTLTISATGNGYASFGIHKITNQTASFTVTAGRVAIIDFVPGDGCRIKSVTANGSSIEVDSHNSVWLTINSNTVVSVEFEKIPVVTYTLTISAIGNGIASYNGTSVRNDSRDFSVSEGSNPNVSFTPDDFNLVKTVKLNGSEVSLSDNSYTISNVSSDNKIEVEFEEIDAKFTTEGVNYQVSSYESRTVVIGEGEYGLSLEVPEKVVSQGYEWTISGISDEAMSANKELAAIIWNPSTTINFRNVNPNLLLYVKDARYAPYGVNNVVINNEAESILLTESPSGNNFYCPIAFTAKKITYSHRYRMRTGGGDSRGWETIALPFDVQRIEHVEEGEILPFAKWSSTSTEKPFWLYQLGASGFIEAEGIKANTPYVISMPNNDVYQDNYKLRGTVTFSSTNVEVKKSDDIVKTTYGNRTLIPNFINLDNNVGNYALNVNNDMESYQGQENEGSVFIQNLRRIHPFEAYMTSTSGTRAIGVFDGMTTAIKGIEDIEKGLHILKVYNLNGQCIKTGTSMESLKHELPAGIYIINNKKIIIK